MNPTHLHDAEGDRADGFSTLAEPVVAERIVYPTDNAGCVEYEPKVAVECKALNDDELRASVWRRSNDGVFGEEVMGVQRHASLLPKRMDFNCGWTIERQSVHGSTTAAPLEPGTTKTQEEGGYRKEKRTSGEPRRAYLHEPL